MDSMGKLGTQRCIDLQACPTLLWEDGSGHWQDSGTREARRKRWVCLLQKVRTSQSCVLPWGAAEYP